MARRVSVAQIKAYERQRYELQQTRADAARTAGVTQEWGRLHEAELKAGTKQLLKQGQRDERATPRTSNQGNNNSSSALRLAAPKNYDALGREAKRSLDDFEYFRLRYFGRRSMPWAVDAMQRLDELMRSPEREYVVINVAPGVGKSTLLHDFAVWETTKQRWIRGLWGSATAQLAGIATKRLRSTLGASYPIKAKLKDAQVGYGVDAEATLVADYGRFRPVDGGVWRAEMFVVEQFDEENYDEKEPTWGAFGQNSEEIGWRANLIIWDDLVTQKTIGATLEAIDEHRRWFDDVAEERLEPGGLFALMGQRLGANDTYRYCVSADALCQTDRGAIAMRDVRVGDRVLTRDGYRDVEWSGSTGWRPTVTIETTSGLSLALTGDHEVSTPSGWIRADALTPGSDLHVIGAALGLAPQVAGAPARVAARTAMPVAAGVEVGVLDGVGVPGAAMIALGEPADPFAPPHVPSMVLTDQVLGSHARRVPAQMRRLVAVGDRGAAEMVVTNHHTGDQLLAGERPVHRGAVARMVFAAFPDEAFADALGSLREPLVAELLPSADVKARFASRGSGPDGLPAVDTIRSITHTDTIEVWDLTVNRTHEFYANGILVHNCLDKVTDEMTFEGADTFDVESRTPMYHHIVYPAHDQRVCLGHDPKNEAQVEAASQPWRPDGTGGCLIDPYRISWKKCQQTMRDEQKWETVYQQGDSSAQDVLVQKLWVDGGLDNRTAEIYVGCWDETRYALDIPRDGDNEIIKGLVSYMCVDPSPSRWWGLIWFAYDPVTLRRYVLNVERKKMQAGEFLDIVGGNYVGLAHEWVMKSHDLGLPIRSMVVEANSAERFLLQYEHVRNWMSRYNVRVIRHQTHANKADPKFGVQTVGGIWRQGLVRLPGLSRQTVKPLVQEVTTYPQGASDDLVMAFWFGEYNLSTLTQQVHGKPFRRTLPSWIRRGELVA